MNSKIQLRAEELNALAPTQIVENEKVEQKFVQMYDAIHGTQTGSMIYAKEKFNFNKVLQDNPQLAQCSKLSLFGCFLDMAVNGLSLDPTGRPHCYLIPRSARTGQKDQNGREIYEKRAYVSITAYGELVMRIRAGQVKYVDNPVIVYEGDTFGVELQSGKKVITYKAAVPRKSNKIIAGFIRIVRNDDSEDYQVMQLNDIERLKLFSAKANNGKANQLYESDNGQIDAGFFENKIIKHAFDSYPKVRIGKFSGLQTEEEEQPEIDYGIEEADAKPVEEAQPEEVNADDPFGGQPKIQQKEENKDKDNNQLDLF